MVNNKTTTNNTNHYQDKNQTDLFNNTNNCNMNHSLDKTHKKKKKSPRFARFNPAKIFEECITLLHVWWNIHNDNILYSLILYLFWTKLCFLIIAHILFTFKLIWQKYMSILVSIYMNHRHSFPFSSLITDKIITRPVVRVANLLYIFLCCPFVLLFFVLYMKPSIACAPRFSILDCPFSLSFI